MCSMFPLLSFAQSTPQGTALVPAFALEDGTPIKLSSLGRYPPAAPARELNCVVAARPAESPYLRLGLLQGYSCLCLVMDSRHGVLRRVDHLMIKNPARNRDLHFELVAKWTNV